VRAAFLVNDIKREFEKAVALDPKDLDAREAMVMFYKEVPGVMGGSVVKARAEAEAMVPYDAVRGLGMLAQVEGDHGTEASFMETMNRLAKVDPGKACIGRAQYHANKKKDVEGAVAELAKMPQIRPKSAPDLTQAAAMLQQLNRWDEALAMLDKALAIDPGYAPATYQIGRACLLSKKDMARAESAFKAYIAAEPTQGQPPRAAARWRLSQVYQETGRVADARRELEQALRDAPNNEDYRKSLAALKAK
jgi:tetratricopeptide (TPR) repeat protein